MSDDEENKIEHKIETFGVAIIMTLLFFFILHIGRKGWNELSNEKKKEIKKACIRDFKLACILTIFSIIILILSNRM